MQGGIRDGISGRCVRDAVFARVYTRYRDADRNEDGYRDAVVA